MPCKMCSSIPGLYPLDASSTSPRVRIKTFSRHHQMSSSEDPLVWVDTLGSVVTTKELPGRRGPMAICTHPSASASRAPCMRDRDDSLRVYLSIFQLTLQGPFGCRGFLFFLSCTHEGLLQLSDFPLRQNMGSRCAQMCAAAMRLARCRRGVKETQPQPECPGPRWHTAAELLDACACLQFRAQPDMNTRITWDGFWKTPISSLAPGAGTKGTDAGTQSWKRLPGDSGLRGTSVGAHLPYMSVVPSFTVSGPQYLSL